MFSGLASISVAFHSEDFFSVPWMPPGAYFLTVLYFILDPLLTSFVFMFFIRCIYSPFIPYYTQFVLSPSFFLGEIMLLFCSIIMRFCSGNSCNYFFTVHVFIFHYSFRFPINNYCDVNINMVIWFFVLFILLLYIFESFGHFLHSWKLHIWLIIRNSFVHFFPFVQLWILWWLYSLLQYPWFSCCW